MNSLSSPLFINCSSHHKPLQLHNTTPSAPSTRRPQPQQMAPRRPTPARRHPRNRHANIMPRQENTREAQGPAPAANAQPMHENNREAQGPAPPAADAQHQPAPQETHDSPAFLEQLRTSGTFVAIAMAQTRMLAGQPLDLYNLVAELRQQRAGSVQLPHQYLYIYSVLLRYAMNKHHLGHIQLDNEAAEQLIQAIANRIYPQMPQPDANN